MTFSEALSSIASPQPPAKSAAEIDREENEAIAEYEKAHPAPKHLVNPCDLCGVCAKCAGEVA